MLAISNWDPNIFAYHRHRNLWLRAMKKCLFQNWRFAIIYFLLCSITEIVKFRKLRLVVLRILMLPTIIGVIASLVYKVLVISTENNWHYFVFTRWRLQEVLVASGGTAWVVCNVRWHGRHSYTMGDELKTMEGQKMRRTFTGISAFFSGQFIYSQCDERGHNCPLTNTFWPRPWLVWCLVWWWCL